MVTAPRRLLAPLPDSIALLGIVVAGVSWSLSVGWARWAEVRGSGLDIYYVVPLLLAGGMATVLSLWFAIGAVLWAMCRACGRRASFRAVLLALSAAGIGLSLAAPAAAFHVTRGPFSAPAILWFLFAAGFTAFCVQVVARLHRDANLPVTKAWGCLALTGIFCASFVSLYQ